jgi:hypothetical protein
MFARSADAVLLEPAAAGAASALLGMNLTRRRRLT